MIFDIPKEFIELLTRLSKKNYQYSNQCKIVLERIPSFKKLFVRTIPNLCKVNLSLIPMIHIYDGITPEMRKKILISQNRITELLENTNTDLIGFEGYSGNEFSLTDLIRQQYYYLEKAPKIMDITNGLIKINRDPAYSGIVNYLKLHPDKNHIVYGVEDLEFKKLSVKVWQLKQALKSHMSQEENDFIVDNFIRIRGLIMTSKIIERAVTKHKEKPILPIGESHIQKEITEIISEYKCPWTVL